MIFGQLNCLLYLEVLRSSASFLESIRSPFLVCLSCVVVPFVDLPNTLEEAGQNPLLSATNILSSRLGKTIIFKDVTGSIASQDQFICGFREKRFRLDTRTPTLHNICLFLCDVIMSLKSVSWLNLCYAKDLFIGGFGKASPLYIIRRPVTN